ncbi:hypothetical protein ACSHT0_10855 [Tepidicaulis sp. LMO-SS28]|uniref:hypothetical protein n=1 Tax=Tepidicaulis sp. LMO-SS28 TaxID=3447455 RepID=UPI003EE39B36
MPRARTDGFDSETASEAQAQVKAARAAVQDDIDDLKDSISASRLADAAIHTLQDLEMEKAMQSVKRTVQENPLPSALTAAGLAWLLYSASTKQSRYEDELDLDWDSDDYDNEYSAGPAESVRETFDDAAHGARVRGRAMRMKARRAGHEAADRAREAGHDVADRARHVGEEVAERARYAGGAAAETSRRAGRKVQETYEAHPLMTGLVGLAAGAALAGLLSRTRAEDETLGETRQRVVKRAKREGQRYAKKADRKTASAVRKAGKRVEKTADGLLQH